jgi:hypothetical protein
MVKQIIKEAMDKNPIGLKEAVSEELKTRIALALEAKMKKEEDDDMGDDEDDMDDDEDDMEEEAQPKWKVKIGNKTYTVTARSTSEADKKAKELAKKDGNVGVPGNISKV